MYGIIIKNRMKEMNLSMSELANKVNVSYSTMSKWVNDKVKIPKDKLKELEKILHIYFDFNAFSEEENAIIKLLPLLTIDEKITIYKECRMYVERKNKKA